MLQRHVESSEAPLQAGRPPPPLPGPVPAARLAARGGGVFGFCSASLGFQLNDGGFAGLGILAGHAARRSRTGRLEIHNRPGNLRDDLTIVDTGHRSACEAVSSRRALHPKHSNPQAGLPGPCALALASRVAPTRNKQSQRLHGNPSSRKLPFLLQLACSRRTTQPAHVAIPACLQEKKEVVPCFAKLSAVSRTRICPSNPAPMPELRASGGGASAFAGA